MLPFDPALVEYTDQHTTPESEVLYRLRRTTHLRALLPQMISGQLQGQLLAFFSQMLQPRRVLEIGTFTGYSTICLAQGLAADGMLHTIDLNEELTPIAQAAIEEAGLAARVCLHTGDAKTVIPTLSEVWDLVFIDADKCNYLIYYDLVFPQVRKGGFIVADNVLWKGKVWQPHHDKKTAALHAYNHTIAHDSRVENVLLPIRDGMMVARKL